MHKCVKAWMLILLCCPAAVWSHARLMSPPSRSSMWRVGFRTRKNFNDNALYCGGIGTQWKKNGGKCGICGDPYDMPHPRDNEAGGKYGKGIISKRYITGQVIEATVEVTTNHRGYFEFKLCPNNNPKKEATQDCLDKHILKEAHGIGTRYYIANMGRGDISVKLQLPKGLTCSQCVFQWTYVAGNNWGMCEDGESRLGCGPQETFRGCADIAIEKSTDIFNFRPRENDVNSNPHGSNRPAKPKKRDRTKSTTTNPNYTYEVSKDTRSSTTRQPVHDHHDHHFRDFHFKRGGYLPSSPITQNSTIAKSLPNKPTYYQTTRRRKHKYDNRYFYQHQNFSSARRKPNKKNSVNSNPPLNRVPMTPNRATYSTNNQFERPGTPHSQVIEDTLMRFLNSDSASTDDSLPQGFNVGGRRYKDFWHL